MANLWEETLVELHENGMTEQDIVWVGTKEVKIPMDLFKTLADKNYDAGYGSAKVATDLMICGVGWHMIRREYDGSEWWEFQKQIEEPKRTVRPRVVVGNEYMWSTLKDMNRPDGAYSQEPWDWEGMEDDA